MARIKLVRNMTDFDVAVSNKEHPGETHGNSQNVAAHTEWTCDVGIPWLDPVFYEHIITFQAIPKPGLGAVTIAIYIHDHTIWWTRGWDSEGGVDINDRHSVDGSALDEGNKIVELRGTTKEDFGLHFI